VHLVLVGPTASGKSALALEVARRLGGIELVSVDSMCVYRGMDLGTAKPSPADQAEVPHHLLDLVEPHQEYAVAEFQAAARAAIAAIAARGHRALLVGGTGLYLRAVVDGLALPGRFPEVRAEIEAEPDTAKLHRRLAAVDPAAATRMEPSNRRRIVRALEVTLGSGRPFSSFGPGLEAYPPVPYVQRAVELPRPLLDQRIVERYRQQLAEGFLDEARALHTHPLGLSRTARQALGYRELFDHLDGHCGLDEAVELAIVRTRRFARRQERWFRRDPRLRWLAPSGDGTTEGANPMAVLDDLLADFAAARPEDP
jgi:tRNA dimethylallyltransferase